MTLDRRYMARELVITRAKDDDGAARVEGIAIEYEAPSEELGWGAWTFIERIAKGCFSDWLGDKDNDVIGLYDHAMGNLLGRRSNETFVIRDSAKNLTVEYILPDTQLGMDVYTLVQRGDLKGMSIGFMIHESELTETDDDGEPDQRRILRADLIEVSLVADPAFSQTSAEARSLYSYQGDVRHRAQDVRDRSILRRRLALDQRIRGIQAQTGESQ